LLHGTSSGKPQRSHLPTLLITWRLAKVTQDSHAPAAWRFQVFVHHLLEPAARVLDLIKQRRLIQVEPRRLRQARLLEDCITLFPNAKAQHLGAIQLDQQQLGASQVEAGLLAQAGQVDAALFAI